MLQAWDPTWTVRRIDAAAALDAAGCSIAHPAGVSAILTRSADGGLVLEALGPTPVINDSTRWTGAPVTARPRALLLPGLVNAHTHLDLTHIGPRPFDPDSPGGFADWIGLIRRERLTDPQAIGAAVRRGVELCLRGGVVLVGDIAGAVGGRPSPAASLALMADGRINGVTYTEFFAQGARCHTATSAAIDVWKSLAPAEPPGPRVAPGMHPHAPYSVGLEAYATVLRQLPTGTPTCTHLAESPQEREFIARGEGPLRDLLDAVGVWDQVTASLVGKGRTPIEHLATPLRGGVVPVHCNDVSDADLAALRGIRGRVVYCPRASCYFGVERAFGPHRYREMLAAGVDVALGTDSIVNLATADRLTPWDDMVLLANRDRVDPVTLLRMATTAGAAALSRDPSTFTLTPLGQLAGLTALPLSAVNPQASAAELLAAALDRGIRDGEDPPPPELLAIGRV